MEAEQCQTETKKKVDFYIQLAKWLLEEGNEDQGERAYRTAVAIAKRESGPDSGITGGALIELWFFYDGLGREKEADETWRELVEVVRARYTELMDPNYG
jgi:hypothetical protein